MSEQRYLIEGNTVRKVNRDFETAPVHRESPKVHAKNAPINMGYVLVMLIAIVAMCATLILYVDMQADIINRVNNIASMEKELNTLKLANDETYTKIVSGVDLEKIKYIAITQLGMTYAKDGQVITYAGNESDYCIQYSDIP